MRRIFISLICVCLITLAGCHSASHPFELFYRSNLGGAANREGTFSYNLYRIPDTTQPKIQQLTFATDLGLQYYLAPKAGDKVVIGMYEREDVVDLLDVRSLKTEDITSRFNGPQLGPHTFPVDWSSDQKQFAIITNEGGFPSLMDFDGSTMEPLNFSSFGPAPGVGDIQWSPDGNELAFSRNTEIQQNPVLFAVFVYDLASKQLTQLTSYDAGCALPLWSPSGRQIAATCSRRIRIFNASNPNEYSETPASASCWSPAWSPSGKQITFVCKQGNSQDKLFVMNFDGKGLHAVSLGNKEGFSYLSDPVWSPDGSQIIYIAGSYPSYTEIKLEIYLMNVDGSNNHALTHQAADYEDLSVYRIR
jgi:Tol biopolymer transport system component